MNNQLRFLTLLPIFLLSLAGCSASRAATRVQSPPVVMAPAQVPSVALPASPAPTQPPLAVPAGSLSEPPEPTADPLDTAAEPNVGREPLTMRAALSHSGYTKPAPEQLLLKVDFRGVDRRPANRPPLNIALLLDRSGSMADDMKFPHAIAAARAVIENLTESDIISVVAFNERALVLSPAGRVVNKPFLFQRLAEVGPAGITDLSAGLLEAIAQVHSQSAVGQVRQVILLTDGQANAGVTDPSALRKTIEAARAKGVGLSTLGCGTDFNQTLLTDLALAGGGRYTYVKSPEQLPSAFRQELRGLLDVVAQNVRLEIAVNEGGAISKVYGQPALPTGPTTRLEIGNLRAGEHGSIMVAIKPTAFTPGSVLEVKAKLTYDVPETAGRVVRAADARAVFAAPGSGVKIEQNEEVVLCGATMDAMDLAMTALGSSDPDRYTKARASFDQWHERVRQYALLHRDQDLLNEAFLLKHFMDELEAAKPPGDPTLSFGARDQIGKQADYQRYQLLHHELTQNK